MMDDHVYFGINEEKKLSLCSIMTKIMIKLHRWILLNLLTIPIQLLRLFRYWQNQC